jgi:outer membrane protein TolC
LYSNSKRKRRILDRSYVPQFSTLAAVSGRGAGTDVNGDFPGGTTGLAPNTFNWAAGIQVTFSVFDFFGLREQGKVQKANVQTEQARYSQSLDDISAATEEAQSTLTGARQWHRTIRLSCPRPRTANSSNRHAIGLAWPL